MINRRTKSALAFFKKQALQKRLNLVYAQVPSGTCKSSTHCCSESVNTFYAEYLNIVQNLQEKNTLKEFSKRAVAYYLTELVVPQKCPLLQEDGRCATYSSRPLPCRVFGHLPKEEYEANYAQVLKENLTAAKELQTTYGIIVPDEVCRHKVPFCENFSSDSEFNSSLRDDLVDELFGIESAFLMEDILDAEEFGLSLVQWFAYDILGREKAQKLRLFISQEISKTGSSQTLQQTLEEVI